LEASPLWAPSFSRALARWERAPARWERAPARWERAPACWERTGAAWASAVPIDARIIVRGGRLRAMLYAQPGKTMSEHKLTESEFKEILKRATDLDAAEKRDFTDEDLQDAANELGLSPAALAAAQTEHLAYAALEKKAPVLPRPFDTQLGLQSLPGAFSVTVPPLGVRTSTVGAVAASLLVLAFMTFWTLGASRGSPLFALFSIPGWIGGLSALASSIAKIAMRTELALTRQSGLLIRSIGPFARRIALDPKHIVARLDDDVTETRNGMTRDPFVALKHGTRTYKLLQDYSVAEQEWVHAELQRWQGKS
jgi:hypothetical protein